MLTSETPPMMPAFPSEKLRSMGLSGSSNLLIVEMGPRL